MELMTYDDLHKVRKKDLIAWMREAHIYLPPISCKEFLREVKLLRLKEEHHQLLTQAYILENKIEAARGSTKLMKELLQESRKLDEKIERLEQRIRALVKEGRL